MPAMERSGTRRVGGLCLFGPASTAAEVVNSDSDLLSLLHSVRARLSPGAGGGLCKEGPLFRGKGWKRGRAGRQNILGQLLKSF